MTVGERLKSVIDFYGMSQRQFALSLKISASHMSGMVKNAQKPTERFLMTLNQSYHVNTDWLLTGTGKMFTDESVSEVKHRLLYAIERLNDDQCISTLAYVECLEKLYQQIQTSTNSETTIPMDNRN